ncbi:MAG: carbonic anhydrase family protein [Oligoflexus sp.]
MNLYPTLYIISFATAILMTNCTSTSHQSNSQTEQVEKYTQDNSPKVNINLNQNDWPDTCSRQGAADQRQSPIPLDEERFRGTKTIAVSFSYKPADIRIVDNGYMLIYSFKEDAGYFELEGKRFALKQFHFHQPAEHTLNGKTYDMEIHFVHIKETKDEVSVTPRVAI